jgi:hypothetical protein
MSCAGSFYAINAAIAFPDERVAINVEYRRAAF